MCAAVAQEQQQQHEEEEEGGGGNTEVRSAVDAIVAAHGERLDALEDSEFSALMEDEMEAGRGGKRILSPYLPSQTAALAGLPELLQGLRAEEDVLLDIGCGDGRVLVALARSHGCRGVGVDISEDCVATAQSIARESGVHERVAFHALDWVHPATEEQRAVKQRSVEESTVVYVYVVADFVAVLQGSLLQMVRDGKRVVTNTYHLDLATAAAEGVVVQARSEELNLQLYGLSSS